MDEKMISFHLYLYTSTRGVATNSGMGPGSAETWYKNVYFFFIVLIIENKIENIK